MTQHNSDNSIVVDAAGHTPGDLVLENEAEMGKQRVARVRSHLDESEEAFSRAVASAAQHEFAEFRAISLVTSRMTKAGVFEHRTKLVTMDRLNDDGTGLVTAPIEVLDVIDRLAKRVGLQEMTKLVRWSAWSVEAQSEDVFLVLPAWRIGAIAVARLAGFRRISSKGAPSELRRELVVAARGEDFWFGRLQRGAAKESLRAEPPVEVVDTVGGELGVTGSAPCGPKIGVTISAQRKTRRFWRPLP